MEEGVAEKREGKKGRLIKRRKAGASQPALAFVSSLHLHTEGLAYLLMLTEKKKGRGPETCNKV